MTFWSIDAWWWPFLFILIAGWLATDAWRFLGVYFGGRISEASDVLGGFNRSSQHPFTGGDIDDRKTQIRTLHPA